METSRRDHFSGSLRLLFEVGTVAGLSDGELLDRFLDRRGIGLRAAEIAFEALIERHGPMVLRVCRARLGNEHDAQDAFQATFLILARKAGSIRDRDSAASWLQGVARRVANCARRAAAVRRARERAASRSSLETSADPDPTQGEVVPAVLEEVSALPEKHRIPLMLCLLDGLTHEEAASRLAWPVGTVKTRVRQAKDKLRMRLARRGFAPTLGAITAALATREASAMPVALVRATARAATRYTSGKILTAGATSASIAALAELGIGSLLMSRIKIASLVVASMGVLAAGAAGYGRQGPGEPKKVEPVQVKTEVKPPVEPPNDVTLPIATEDRADSLRLDIELLQFEVDLLKSALSSANNLRINTDASLAQVNGTNNPTEAGIFDLQASTPEEAIQKHKRFLTNRLQELEVGFKAKRANYLAKSHELRAKQQQLKELEESAAGAAPASADVKKDSKPDQPKDHDRLVEAITASLELDMIQADYEFWKNRVFATKETLFQLKKTARSYQQVKPSGMTDKEYDATKNSYELQLADAQKELADAEKHYQQLVRTLAEVEVNLGELVRELPPQVQSKYMRWQISQKPVGITRPSADVENRLSNVERKLDLILKAIEARPTK